MECAHKSLIYREAIDSPGLETDEAIIVSDMSSDISEDSTEFNWITRTENTLSLSNEYGMVISKNHIHNKSKGYNVEEEVMMTKC